MRKKQKIKAPLKKKKERFVKCRFFQVKEHVSPGVELLGGEFRSAMVKVGKFLSDGKELVEAIQSSVVVGYTIITKITIFYRDKDS